MSKKQFKAESKRLLELMVNSIYTNKDIFLRELISNASDAIDKLYYQSLTDEQIDIQRKEFKIYVNFDKDSRSITISDNGIGMSDEELERNLGTICESGSLLFKKENEKRDDIDVIGQFGVGFYSAFMVASKIVVTSRKYGEKDAYVWESDGVDGYTIKKDSKDSWGTEIKLYLKNNNEDVNYDEYLENYKLEEIIKKYSNYITYPVIMIDNERGDEKKEKIVNSMTPIWKKNFNDVQKEEYDRFYTDTYYDYENPLHVFRNNVEGKCSYTSLLFIPNHAPYDFYQKDYEKGLALYSNGVLIMDKCSELLPDHFNFIKGLVDSPDVSLNISREILQQDKQVSIIAKSIESKIRKELEMMLKEDREKYIGFFKNFGIQLKFGMYNDFGMHKDELKDLVLFYSSKNEKLVTLKEYVDEVSKDQDKIYYACGETVEKIDMLPQVETFKDKGYDVLYFTDYVDEFAVKMLNEYDGKTFVNISSEDVNLDSDEDKKRLEKLNNESKELLNLMKDSLKESVNEVKFTSRLKNHPVCLTTKGHISTEMEKIINAMPTDESVKAETVLEINKDHAIVKKLEELYEKDKEKLASYTKVLYAQARLIEGLSIENPSEISNLICEIISE